MLKARAYTSLVRTPSSMALLIGQRARVLGQINLLVAQQVGILARIKALPPQGLACAAVWTAVFGLILRGRSTAR